MICEFGDILWDGWMFAGEEKKFNAVANGTESVGDELRVVGSDKEWGIAAAGEDAEVCNEVGRTEVTSVIGDERGSRVLLEVETRRGGPFSGVKFAPVAGMADGTILVCCLRFLNSVRC